jgi:hypothetical protein
MRQAADLPIAQQKVILEGLIYLFKDPGEAWRPTATVMEAGGKPALIVEMIAGELHMTARAGIARNDRLLLCAWGKVLEYAFFTDRQPVVQVLIPAYRRKDFWALERLGCWRQENCSDKHITYRRYVCRPEDLRILS